MLVRIDTRAITDWSSFHRVFAEAFGFPDFYGRNMDAWIDCISSLDTPEEGMTRIRVQPGEVLTLQLNHVRDFAARCPEQYSAVIECSAFVNWRRVEGGASSLVALAFHP